MDCIQVLVWVYMFDWRIHMLSVHLMRARTSAEPNYLFIPIQWQAKQVKPQVNDQVIACDWSWKNILSDLPSTKHERLVPISQSQRRHLHFLPTKSYYSLHARCFKSIATNFVKMLKYPQICMRYNAMKNKLIIHNKLLQTIDVTLIYIVTSFSISLCF